MINLEALQVFSIDDGAGGLVMASWIEAYGIEGVPKAPHSITISSEEARLLAKELNAATEAAEVSKLYETLPEGYIAQRGCPQGCGHSCHTDITRTAENMCSTCDFPEREPKEKEPGGTASSANTVDLHMHGLAYYRGAHCSGHQSQHQQVAVSNV